MPFDLPPNVSAQGVQQQADLTRGLMGDIMHNGAAVHNLVRMSAFRKFDEIGSIESRANSGVIATPIASPTTQAGT